VVIAAGLFFWATKQSTPQVVLSSSPSCTQNLNVNGIVYAPCVLPASQSGDVVGFDLQNNQNFALAARYITFGEVFSDGQVPSGDQLSALINGVSTPVQLDAKATYPDGDVLMGIVSFEEPSIPASTTLQGMFKLASSSGQPIVISGLLSSGYNVKVNITFNNNGTKYNLNASSLLQQAINSGTLSYWLQGPEATEVRVDHYVTSSLHVVFDIREYADGSTYTDVEFDNDYAMQPSGGALNYSVYISQSGATVFQQNVVRQPQYTTWHKEAYSNGAPLVNVVHNTTALEDANATLGFDVADGWDYNNAGYDLSPFLFKNDLTTLATNATFNAILGPAGGNRAMSGVGQGPNIGPVTAEQAIWLITQNQSIGTYVLDQADADGSVPWHFFNPATGSFITTQQYPELFVGDTNGGEALTQPLLNFNNSNITSWQTDEDHQPDFAYIPYLLTGSHYYLDQLEAQGTYTVLNEANLVRHNGEDILVNYAMAPRGAAWAMRMIDENAYIDPNSDQLKSYFEQVQSNNFNYLLNETENLTQGQTYGWHFTVDFYQYTAKDGMNVTNKYNGSYPYGGQAPWQQDFFESTLALAAEQHVRGALQVLNWEDNFEVGRFLAGPQGFSPQDGCAYNIVVASNNIYAKGYNISTWGKIVNLTLPIPTWAQIESDEKTINQSEDGIWRTSKDNNYCQLGLETLAEAVTVTQSGKAMQAYAWLVSNRGLHLLNIQYFNPWTEFAVAPRLKDNNYLSQSEILVDNFTTPGHTIQFSNPDALIADIGHGGDTLMGNPNGISILSDLSTAGGSTLKGEGGAYTYMYDNSTTGNDKFEPSSGINYMAAGLEGSDNFTLYSSTSANDTISGFVIGRDYIYLADLARTQATYQNLISGATSTNGNATLHLSSNHMVTLLGINKNQLTTSIFSAPSGSTTLSTTTSTTTSSTSSVQTTIAPSNPTWVMIGTLPGSVGPAPTSAYAPLNSTPAQIGGAQQPILYNPLSKEIVAPFWGDASCKCVEWGNAFFQFNPANLVWNLMWTSLNDEGVAVGNITSISRTNGVTTFTTSQFTARSYLVGSWIQIGKVSDQSFDGQFQVTSVTNCQNAMDTLCNTFTYSQPGLPNANPTTQNVTFSNGPGDTPTTPTRGHTATVFDTKRNAIWMITSAGDIGENATSIVNHHATNAKLYEMTYNSSSGHWQWREVCGFMVGTCGQANDGVASAGIPCASTINSSGGCGYYWPAMGYDPTSDVVVIAFGEWNSGLTNETLLYYPKNNTWVNACVSCGPKARYMQVSNKLISIGNGRLLLYGGSSSGGEAGTNLSDTWIFSTITKTWTRVNSAVNPPATSNPTMDFDPVINRAVLVIDNQSGSNVWEFNPTTLQWSNMNVKGGPAYYGLFLETGAYDAATNQFIVFSRNNTLNKWQYWALDNLGGSVSNSTSSTSTTTTTSTSTSTTTTILLGIPTLYTSNTPSVGVGQYESFNAVLPQSKIGKSPYTYNYQVVNSITDALVSNQLWTGVASSSNTFTIQINSGELTNTLKANVSIKDSESPSNTVNSIYTQTIILNPLPTISTSSTTTVSTSIFTTIGTTSTISQGAGGGGGGGGSPGGGSSKPALTAVYDGYKISNVAQLNSFNVTINGTLINVLDNFITPTSTGVTLQYIKPATLSLDQPVTFNVSGVTYYAELLNISYLPIEQTVTLAIYNASPYAISNTVGVTLNVSNSSVSLTAGPSSNSISIKNATNVPPLPQYDNKIAVFNISSNLSNINQLALNIFYPCSVPVSSLQLFELLNNSWQPISGVDVNQNSCELTFVISADPIIAITNYNPPVTTIITTSPSTTSVVPPLVKINLHPQPKGLLTALYLSLLALILLIASYVHYYSRIKKLEKKRDILRSVEDKNS
jgi:hypothetical protein